MSYRPVSTHLPLALLLGACAAAGPAPLAPSAGDAATSAAITPADARTRVEVLAADSMQGREAGTVGEDRAARYLVAEARRLGLRPADPAGYLLPVPLTRRRVTAEVRHVGTDGTTALGEEDVVSVSGIVGLPATTETSGAGRLVYAGHLFDPGVGADELELDQLRDAVVVVRVAPAPGVDGNVTPRLPIASQLGPGGTAAAVLLVDDGSNPGVWEYATEVAERGVVELAAGTGPGDGPAFFLVRPEAVERLVGAEVAAGRTPRTDLGRVEFSLREEVAPLPAHNVAAVLPGSDPELSGEYVALGAHYDHVGVGEPVDGDSIYNGADDDASGTAALLEIAERLSALPAGERPARSILFVWHTAEESGLLGSEHFTNESPVPLDEVVAQLNIDMIGRNGADSLFLVGSRRLSTPLGDLVEEVNQARPDPFVFDYSYDEPGHPEQVYCRSDHYNYARYGVPVVFFTSGLHDDYHQPSDEPDTLDYEKLARATTLIGDIASEVADLPARPAVDRPVPPLGSPCTG